MSTSSEPFSLSRLTTDVSDTPAHTVTTTATSVYQTVTTTADIFGLDFAFIFDVDIDFGDLPAPYPTSLGDSPTGAYHFIEATPTLYFGTIPDSESDATANGNATGDDITNADDEDGISFVDPNSWFTGTNGGSLVVDVTGTGWIVGYMDFNEDGDFQDPGELIINQGISAGLSTVFFDVPAGTDFGGGLTLYSRFRLFESAPPVPSLAYTGSTDNGEVEDYGLQLNISRTITTNLFLSYKIQNK